VAILWYVANILGEQAFQVAFVNCNDVIQEITTATPTKTLCHFHSARTFERSADRLTLNRTAVGTSQSIPGITIKDEVNSRGASKWKNVLAHAISGLIVA